MKNSYNHFHITCLMKNLKMIIISLSLCLFSVQVPAIAFQAGGINTDIPLSEDYSKKLQNIRLVWNPSETVMPLDINDTLMYQNKKISIKRFNDIRNKQQEIGKNVEKRYTKNDIYATTKDNIAEWLTDNFTRVLHDSFDISTVSTNADAIIESDILRFYVFESERYVTEIALNIKLRSNTGSVLWEGIIAGKSDNWGASLRASNYNEGLSNACIKAAYNLFTNDSFKMAFKSIK